MKKTNILVHYIPIYVVANGFDYVRDIFGLD